MSTSTNLIFAAAALIGAYAISESIKSRVPEPIPEKEKAPFVYDPSTYISPYPHNNFTKEKYEQKQRASKAKHNAPSRGKYHYHVIISNASRDYETYEQEILANGDLRLKRKTPNASELNGTYVWDMDTYLENDDAILSYIINHFQEMKKYKVQPGTSYSPDDLYNDYYDEYVMDPEDEETFDPDIFYANQD